MLSCFPAGTFHKFIIEVPSDRNFFIVFFAIFALSFATRIKRFLQISEFGIREVFQDIPVVNTNWLRNENSDDCEQRGDKNF